jgi:peptidoglycan/LPS O-acetylase OafA/YrhL
MQSPNRRYLPAVDHLRAFAALLIVLYHGVHTLGYRTLWGTGFTPEHWPHSGDPLFAALLEGHSAVALFLVLSGFIFCVGARGRRVRYGGFLRSRLLRIYPLMLALLLLATALYPGTFSFLGLLQTLLGGANLPGALAAGSVTALFWTIAVEWQFYLIFPFLMAFYDSYGGGWLLRLIALAILARFAALLLGGSVRDIAYYSLLGRIDQFLIGMLAAGVFLDRRLEQRLPRWLVVPAGFAVLAMLVGFHALGGWPTEAGWKVLWPTLEGVVWCGFILAYLAAASALPARVSSVLARVGEVSFSIYLLHILVVDVVATRHLWLNLGFGAYRDALLTTLGLIVPVVLGLSFLTYATIERPFLRLRRPYLE